MHKGERNVENNEYKKRAIALESNDQPKIIARLEDRVLLITLLQTLDKTKQQLNLIDQLKKTLFYGRESKYVELVRETTDKKIINDDKIFKPYLEAVERFKKDPKLIRLLHGVMGIASEVEELIEALQKGIEGGELDRVNWMEEIGDCFWYQNIIADVFGFTFDEVLKMNIEKLESRYKKGFSETDANNRNLNSERESLESNA